MLLLYFPENKFLSLLKSFHGVSGLLGLKFFSDVGKSVLQRYQSLEIR